MHLCRSGLIGFVRICSILLGIDRSRWNPIGLARRSSGEIETVFVERMGIPREIFLWPKQTFKSSVLLGIVRSRWAILRSFVTVLSVLYRIVARFDGQASRVGRGWNRRWSGSEVDTVRLLSQRNARVQMYYIRPSTETVTVMWMSRLSSLGRDSRGKRGNDGVGALPSPSPRARGDWRVHVNRPLSAFLDDFSGEIVDDLARSGGIVGG